MTAHSEMQAVIESLRAGADDYLTKPLQYDVVQWSVERAIARRTAKREHEELQRTLNERLVLSSIREQELAESEARQRDQLNALLANLTEGVLVADPRGQILMINDPARAILGLGDKRPAVDALHSLEAYDVRGVRLSGEQRPLMRALRGQTFTDYEVVRVRPNGDDARGTEGGDESRSARCRAAMRGDRSAEACGQRRR